MAFVKEKRRKGKDGKILRYYYLTESYRNDGRVRQRTLKYLGTHPPRGPRRGRRGSRGEGE